MYVERLLQVSMATLVTLGTLLLGMGERNLLLPLLAVIVAVSSVYLTDVKGWLQLNTTLANVAAIAALWLSVRDLDALHSERQLVSMANLLIYLQFVLMLRKKTTRSYWMLALLSLLQVAVAAALNLSIVFGLLLLVYMFVGMMTLALFFVYREMAAHDASADAPGEEPIVSEAARRWPLAAVPAGFSGKVSGGTEQAGLVWALFRQVARLSVVSLLLAVVVFFVMPRIGNTDGWRTRPGGAYRVVGFSESVTLGELGEAYENPGEVMQVELFDLEGEPYRLGDQPLFRGALLQKYDRGRWSRRGQVNKPRMRIVEQLPPNEELVRQVIRAAPLDDDTLFCIAPSFLVSPDDESNKYLCYSERTEQILRDDEAERQLLKFELVTTGLRDHFTSNISVATHKPSEGELKQMLELPEEKDGRDPLVGLRAVAAQRVSQIPSENRQRRAESLTNYLRDEGAFSYSLSPVSREKTLDPVEDFVTLNRVGHCEYFASALTLMLRSVGIPARMAVGFKGGEWNNVGRFYQVRQLHAHTWVEAYLETDDLPARLINSQMAKDNGAWLTLDPTPASEEEEPGFGEYAFNQLADFSQYIWSNYVMGMDAQRQQEDIYQPVIESIEGALARLADPESRREIIRHLLGSNPRGWTWTDGWFHWRAMIAVMAGLLLVVFAWRGLRWAVRTVLWIVRRRRLHTARRAASQIQFYCRFEEVLASHGWLRPSNQTQYEFAVAAGGQLAESPLTQQAAGLPRRIVEAFYRVRFGQASLDNAEAAAVEEAVSELAGALEQKANGNWASE